MSLVSRLQSKITIHKEAQFWWGMGASGTVLMFGPLVIIYGPATFGEPWDAWLHMLMAAVALFGVLWFWLGLFALNRGEA